MEKRKTLEKRKVDFGEPPSIRFNILVVGESGSGKTTMLKTLFKEYCDNKIELNVKAKSQKTVNTECIGTFPLCSVTGKCIVHLYDSPGYGDYINNQSAIDRVRSFLITAHEKWLSIDGNKQSDQDIDKEFIKQLYQLGPIIPVVGKADTMTIDERRDHLLNIRKRIQELVDETNEHVIYDFQENTREATPDNYYLPEDSPPNTSILESAEHISMVNAAEQVASMIDSEESTSSTVALENQSVEATSLEEDENLLWPSNSTHVSDQIVLDIEELEYSHAYSSDAGTANVISASQITDLELSVFPTTLPRIRNIFAIVCDTSSSGKRSYPWGEIYIHDENHSDFRRLQRLLLERSKILALKTLTQNMSIQLLENEMIFQQDTTRFPLSKYAVGEQQDEQHGPCWKIRWECFIEWLEMVFVTIGWTCLILVVAPWVFVYFILTLGMLLCALQRGFENCLHVVLLVIDFIFPKLGL